MEALFELNSEAQSTLYVCMFSFRLLPSVERSDLSNLPKYCNAEPILKLRARVSTKPWCVQQITVQGVTQERGRHEEKDCSPAIKDEIFLWWWMGISKCFLLRSLLEQNQKYTSELSSHNRDEKHIELIK